MTRPNRWVLVVHLVQFSVLSNAFQSLWNIVAAVIHLGNITFEGDSHAVVCSPETVDIIAGVRRMFHDMY